MSNPNPINLAHRHWFMRGMGAEKGSVVEMRVDRILPRHVRLVNIIDGRNILMPIEAFNLIPAPGRTVTIHRRECIMTVPLGSKNRQPIRIDYQS